MAPALWLPMLLIIIYLLTWLKTMLYFSMSSLSLSKANSSKSTIPIFWLW